jgi:hypothetical protein
MPPGDDALIRRIQDLERVVRELQAQDVLRTAGLIAAPNKLTVEGELDVTGPLTLPAGIIGNDALANPVGASQFYQGASSVSVPTGGGWNAIVTQTVTVPTGFTKAEVSASAYVHLTATAVELDVRAVINGTSGPSAGHSNTWTESSFFTQLLTGLTPGGTFAVQTQALANNPSALTSDSAIIQGTVTWLR